MMCGACGRTPRLIPLNETRACEKLSPTLARIEGHHRDRINACKEGRRAGADFEYGGLLTEIVLAGNVAIRTDKRLNWDGPGTRATNCPEADQCIRREYHNGWTL